MAAMSGKKYQEENNGWHKKWVNQRVPPIYAAWRSKIPVVCYADPSYHGRFQIQTLSHRSRFFFIKTENLCIYLILKYCFKVIECLLRPIKPIVKWRWPLHQLRLPSLGYHPSWSVKNWCNVGRVMSQKNFVHTYLLTFNSTHIFIVVFISAHEIECYHKKTIEVWSNRAY